MSPGNGFSADTKLSARSLVHKTPQSSRARLETRDCDGSGRLSSRGWALQSVSVRMPIVLLSQGKTTLLK